MAFNSINKQFTLDSFTAYLAGLARPSWPRASTYHNTYSPTEAQWRGKASMDSMQATYVGKGWTAGPHCFLALHAPNPADNGIWVMTPPTAIGVHAGDCNSDHFGIEVVGDFQSTPPSADQQQLLIDTVAALHRWVGIGPNLVAHRDCMADRTCPGDAFYALKPSLQQRLAQALQSDPLKTRTLPGVPGQPAIFCSAGAANFYTARGGLTYCGYPLLDQFHDTSLNCAVLICERVIIKESAQFGIEQALLSEARREGWLP
jgi:hypothetical protein